MSNDTELQEIIKRQQETISRLELENAEFHARVVEFESQPTIIPPSESDTGKIRTGIDALAHYVEAVDHLTGAVKGLEAEFANLPSVVKLAAAEGAADAVINLVTRVENLESQVQACEGCPRRRLASGL
jgi:hypothetical protein